MKKTLLLNIGNTHVQKAIATKFTLTNHERIPTKEFINKVWHRKIDWFTEDTQTLVACVVPVAEVALRDCYEKQIHFLRHSMISNIHFSHVDAPAIGADRLANVVAALHYHPKPPVLILDAGTAITIEIIDKQNQFWSGAIMPGRYMARKSLADNTGLLHKAEMRNTIPKALATTTDEAIWAGVDLGTLGAVEKLIKTTFQEINVKHCPVIVVGGDAQYFVDNIQTIPQLQHGKPYFTLLGLAKLASNPQLWDSKNN